MFLEHLESLPAAVIVVIGLAAIRFVMKLTSKLLKLFFTVGVLLFLFVGLYLLVQ